jgi:hypothetical protein
MENFGDLVIIIIIIISSSSSSSITTITDHSMQVIFTTAIPMVKTS